MCVCGVLPRRAADRDANNIPPTDFRGAAVLVLFIVMLGRAVLSVCVYHMRFNTTGITTGGSCCVLSLWPIVSCHA